MWDSKDITHLPFKPTKTLEINAAVNGLIWSPHCKELFSAHGVQFEHKPARDATKKRTLSFIPSVEDLRERAKEDLLSTGSSDAEKVPVFEPRLDVGAGKVKTSKQRPTIVNGPLQHSLLVHDYPSGKRLMTMAGAHRTTVSSFYSNGIHILC